MIVIVCMENSEKARQQGRSERKPEAYVFVYVEGLSEARTQLAGFCAVLR